MDFREYRRVALRTFVATSEQNFQRKNLPPVTKMAPAMLRKLFDKSPQHKDSDCEKLLRPGQDPRNSQSLENEASNNGTYKKFSDAEAKDRNKHDIKNSCVQVCPHETLSYERMKRIVNLSCFRYNGRKVGAFTKTPGPHHASSAAGSHLCTPHPRDFGSLQASGFYRYEGDCHGYFDGLMLCVNWTMSFDEHMDLARSVSLLRRFLDGLDIQLCPHTKMDDWRMAAKLHALCQSSPPAKDPVEAYVEAHRGRRMEACEECFTTFETYKDEKGCHILVKRYLGKGFSAYEKRWLAQCGEGKHRLRSFGAAVSQAWRAYVGDRCNDVDLFT